MIQTAPGPVFVIRVLLMFSFSQCQSMCGFTQSWSQGLKTMNSTRPGEPSKQEISCRSIPFSVYDLSHGHMYQNAAARQPKCQFFSRFGRRGHDVGFVIGRRQSYFYTARRGCRGFKRHLKSNSEQRVFLSSGNVWKSGGQLAP